MTSSRLPATRSSFVYFFFGGMLVLTTACLNEVDDSSGSANAGGHGGAGTSTASVGGFGGGTGGTTTSVGGQGGTPTPAADGIAIRVGDIPPTPSGSGPGTSVSSSSGGPSQDPDTLRLILGDQPTLCADPNAWIECGNHWRVDVSLPVGMQQPGVYSLAGLNGFMSVTGDGPGTECSAGGGSFFDGDIEIVSIDQSGVAIIFSDTFGLDFNADGPHYLARCPSP